MNNLCKWLLMVFGKAWAEPLLNAINTVDPGLPLADAKVKLCAAVQDCHTVSGTLRGWICKGFKAAPDTMALAVIVSELVQILEKYAPVPA